MLLVDLPPGYERERAYALDVVLTDQLGLTYTARTGDRNDIRIRLADDPAAAEIRLPDTLFSTDRGRWLTAETLPKEPLRWIETRQNGRPGGMPSRLPVLYGNADARQGFERTPDGVRFSIDVLGSAFFLLTRYEEIVSTERDQHERFPGRASLSSREGFLERPIVDEYVDLLWEAAQLCWPRLRRRQTEYRVHVSHDVDHPFTTVGVPVGGVLRSMAGDIVRRRDPSLARRRLRSYRAVRHGHFEFDPFNTYDFLMDVSERQQLRSAFYFLAGADGTPYASTYRLDDAPISALLRHIAGRGHEIGFHGSYASMRDRDCLRSEFEQLLRVTGTIGIHQERWGGRQHYLRWENPATWNGWEHAGLDYDASVGFADLPGFRTGTCREHAVFDLLARRSLRLRERPLHIMMDGTPFDYMGLSRADAAELIIRIARRCRSHRGDLFLLCHNSWLVGQSEKDWYRSVLAAITS
jgi:hypothetical protein